MAVRPRLEQGAGFVRRGKHIVDLYFHSCEYTNIRIYSQCRHPPDVGRQRFVAPMAEGSFAVNVDRAVLAMAGTMILVSLTLGRLVSPYWLLLAVFVGANQLQAAFTGFCPAATLVRKLGLRPRAR